MYQFLGSKGPQVLTCVNQPYPTKCLGKILGNQIAEIRELAAGDRWRMQSDAISPFDLWPKGPKHYPSFLDMGATGRWCLADGIGRVMP